MITLIKSRNALLKLLYKSILKKIFFSQDPEQIHDRMTAVGVFMGRFRITRALSSTMFGFEHKALKQTVAGIDFVNPIGLAAGFDKNALLTQILPSVGFGFEEVGSITGEACAGNSGQRLWRLKKSQSLLVYYGLKNDGCDVISERLSSTPKKFPIGISIAKTNSPKTVNEPEGIADYAKAYMAFKTKNIGDYFTINISCPNAYGGEPFTDPDKLDRLLAEILRQSGGWSKPVFVKLPAEMDMQTVDRVIEVCRKHKITGFISSNLAKSRSNPLIKDNDIPDVGGMSGKVVQELSDRLIAHIYTQTRGEFIIIGCGGVFNAEDAYRKIKNGASLIQMITGMVYEGPQVISEIKIGLVELLQKDGFDNISKAVGSGIK